MGLEKEEEGLLFFYSHLRTFFIAERDVKEKNIDWLPSHMLPGIKPATRVCALTKN